MNDPLIEQENRLERVIRGSEKIIRDQEIMKADIEFSRKPLWVKMSEEGDYMSDGSDHQPYESEE